MTNRQKLIRAVIIVLIIAGMLAAGFVLLTREKAHSDPATQCVDYSWDGPYYRMDAGQQASWQNGWACYFNLIDGRTFPCNWDSAFYDMTIYHGERMQNWLENWAATSDYPWPPPDAGLIIVLSALQYNMDYRHAAGALVCENWECFGLTGHDPYGMSRHYPGFAEATTEFFHNLTVTPGYAPWTPEQVSGNYNKFKPVYMRNWIALFWSVR